MLDAEAAVWTALQARCQDCRPNMCFFHVWDKITTTHYARALPGPVRNDIKRIVKSCYKTCNQESFLEKLDLLRCYLDPTEDDDNVEGFSDIPNAKRDAARAFWRYFARQWTTGVEYTAPDNEDSDDEGEDDQDEEVRVSNSRYYTWRLFDSPIGQGGTNNSIEARNGVLRRQYTHKKSLTLLQAIQLMQVYVADEGLIRGRVFATVPKGNMV